MQLALRSAGKRVGRRVITEVAHWAQRTTVEGVPNLMAARNLWGRIFWILLLTTIASFGLFHLTKSIQNFLASGFSSQVTIDAAPVEFPSVSICSLKPAAESLLKYYDAVVHRHLDHNWKYFDNWFLHERRQGTDEGSIEYRRRIRLLFFQMLEIMWISDDLRDLSLMDHTTVLDCSFNGIKCADKNFSLVQHHEYWNCYMFTPHDDLKFDNPAGEHEAGLTMSFFTDSNFFKSSYDTSSVYISQDSKRNYHLNGTSLRQFLTANKDEFPLNKILTLDEFKTDGFMVIIHQTGTYPMLQKPRFIIQSSMAATLQVFSVEQNKLNRPDMPCTAESLGHIDYVVAFGKHPDDLLVRRFVKTAEDLHYLKVQQEIYRQCHCFSHRIPFLANKTELCYYAPTQVRKTPTRDMLTRINCHDVWMRKTSEDMHLLIETPEGQILPCHNTYSEVHPKTAKWPSEEDIVPATILYFMHKFANGTELVGPNEKHNHNIFNFTDAQVRAAMPTGRQIVSRENVAIQALLLPHCGYMKDFNESHMADAAECLNTQAVRRNVMKVNVRLVSPAAIVYNDSSTYDNMEFVSEIGGVLGLWFGVSLLTGFEIFELIYLITRAGTRRPSTHSSDSGSTAN